MKKRNYKSEFRPLYGVMGWPVKHSLSPLMHNHCFEKLGIPGIYVYFEVEPGNLESAVLGARALGVMGFNVTVPHKQPVMEFLDEIDPDALKIGAVNTVVLENGKYKGLNTDEPGFRLFLKLEGIEVQGRRILILGAGGSAFSVAAGLLKLGAKITIANRTFSRAEELKKKLTNLDKRYNNSGNIECARFEERDLKHAAGVSDLVVNTTPVGMAPETDRMPMDPAWLPEAAVVIDLIYNPPETKLLSRAKGRGSASFNGLEMLIHQGALAFALWTKSDPPVELMRSALNQVIERM